MLDTLSLAYLFNNALESQSEEAVLKRHAEPDPLLDYLEASGTPKDAESLQLIRQIHARVPDPGGVSRDDIVAIKNQLESMGFEYDWFTFCARDVLTRRKGNCLGLPLLIAGLYLKLGGSVKLRVIVSPQDFTFENESLVLSDLLQSIRYDRPALADWPEDNRWHRFHPLEHMVIDLDGDLVDCTPDEDTSVPSFETSRVMNYHQALSCVYQDRAATAYDAGHPARAREIAPPGLKLFAENRELWGLTAALAREYFDDGGFDSAIERYRSIGGDDSLYHWMLYDLTDDVQSVQQAIARYPAGAWLLMAKARVIAAHDPGEAGVESAIATHLAAAAAVIDLPRFYSENAGLLSRLHGDDRIADILDSLQDFQGGWGFFDYHLAMYRLTGDRLHAAEAREALETPRQELNLLLARAERGEKVETELQKLERCHQGSRLYDKSRNDAINWRWKQ